MTKTPLDAPSSAITPDGVSRRQVLLGTGAGALGLAAVGVLAACSSSSGSTGGSTAGADGSLAKVSDVPVGGALIVTGTDGKPIALVQATSGTITALSAVCTHQGCTVKAGSGELDCPCHGSVFGLDGAVKHDPATKPLPAVDVHVSNGTVYAGKG